MGQIQTIPMTIDQNVPDPLIELDTPEPEIPLVKAQIKHVVLYYIDKLSIHRNSDLLQFTLDCAIAAHLTASYIKDNQRILLETLELPAQMKQNISIPNITNEMKSVIIEISKSSSAEIPLTDYILIDNVIITIELNGEMPKITHQQFKIGEAFYNSFDVFGIGTESENHHDHSEQKEGSMENTEELCVICTTDPREILLLPCRHIAICADCYEEVKDRTKQCPICRMDISAAINFSKREQSSDSLQHQNEQNEVAIDLENVHMN